MTKREKGLSRNGLSGNGRVQRQEQATQTELAYFVCFYEIYGGRVLDLLNQRKVLRVRTPSPHPPFPRAPTLFPLPPAFAATCRSERARRALRHSPELTTAVPRARGRRAGF